MDNQESTALAETTGTELTTVEDNAIAQLKSAGLTAQSIKSFVYEDNQGRIGITKDGINEIGRILHVSIIEGSVRVINETDERIRIEAAARSADDRIWYGYAEVDKYIGKRYDPHHFPKGATRAQRNAIKGHLPTQWLQQIIESFIKNTGSGGVAATDMDDDMLADYEHVKERLNNSVESFRQQEAIRKSW